MRYFQRQDEPEFLQQNAALWNQQWATRKSRNSGATFSWSQYKGQAVNQLLVPLLQAQTQRHCSYCDDYPPMIGDDTIDHFCPKSNSLFYLEAYSWKNLYCACNHCQRAKMEKYAVELLRPDDTDYSFERYFIYNYTTHEVEVNPAASVEDQKRAAVTQHIFQFNYSDKQRYRRHVWERWTNMPAEQRVLDDFPFRFIFT